MDISQLEFPEFKNQFACFPGTRFMGSKNKIIHEIWNIIKHYDFQTFLDAFSGSNVVGYFMKVKGKNVISNDFMSINYYHAKAIIENSRVILSDNDISFLLNHPTSATFITETFRDIYFIEEDNIFLDQIRSNIECFECPYKKSLAISALVRACLKKRPRGVFTFVGQRYDDGRKDIKKTLKEHFLENVTAFNEAVFENETSCYAFNADIQDLSTEADLVYFDPPYFTPNSDNDYVRRYHFVEGLARNWEGLDIQKHTKTKKFKSYASPFSKKEHAYSAFENLIKKYQKSIIVISYSSNSLPAKDDLVLLMKKYKNKVVVHEIDHTYSFGNQNHKIGNEFNKVKEYLFIGTK
jgi:DNA adenine methylase